MLTRPDFDTATWTRLAGWAAAELARLRAQNDSKTLDPVATAALRGEIAFAKRFIGLPAFVAEEEARERTEPTGF